MSELLNVVGLGTGVALYAMLLVMVVRVPHRSDDGSGDWLPLATAILGLTWNLCALPLYTVTVATTSPLLPYVAVVGFSALGFLPAVVVHSALRAGEAGSAHRAARQILTAMAYAASAAAVVINAIALAEGNSVPAVAAMRLLTYMFTAIVVPIAVVTRHQRGGRRALAVAALAAFTVSALHLTQLHTAGESWFVELAGHHASLLLALAILYQDYRFAFADLFLKRALTIFVLVVAAFVALAVLAPLTAAGPNAVSVTARDLGLLVTLWVITALAYPWLHSSVGWFVDHVVLERPNYGALRRKIAAQLREHDDVELLLDDMCRLTTPAFGGVAARWHEVTPQAAEGVGLVSTNDGRVTILIPTGDAPQYVLESLRLTDGRRLLSDDVAALEIIGVGIARRIDAIRLTRERWDRELREQEMSKLATEAELRALRAQINPHFLFNALTTIGYLIQAAPPRALETLMRLTALLRGVLKSEGELTTLGHEIDLIEAYLDVERARFEDRLDVRIFVPQALRAASVPPLLLQPIVENAIKHGVTPQRNGGRIVVTATVDPDHPQHQLCVSVRDTGGGATEPVLQRGRERGLGLRNVERRLAAQYGSAASLTIESSPGLGMLVEIRLPVSLWTDVAGAH